MALLTDYYNNTDTGDNGNSGAFGDQKETRDAVCDQMVADSGGVLDKDVKVHSSGAANDTAPWTTAGIAHGGFKLTFTSDAIGPVWDASKYTQQALTTYTDMGDVDAATGDVVINHLQIDLNAQTASVGIRLRSLSKAVGCFVKNGAGAGSGVYCAANAPLVINSIITGVPHGVYLENWLSGAAVYNCVICNSSTAGIYRKLTNGTDPTVKNTALFNNADDFSGQFGTIEYCAYDDADSTSNEVTESSSDTWWTSDFVDAVNGNFTLLGTSNLDSAGVDLSGIFTIDISDIVRTNWSVGAHDNASAGAIIQPPSIPSTEAFGSAQIQTGSVDLLPNSIPSSESIGSATLSSGNATITTISIESSEAFGDAVVQTGTVTLQLSSIPSSEAIGAVTLSSGSTISLVSIDSSEAHGLASLLSGSVSIEPDGIESSEQFGTALIEAGAVVILPDSIESTEQHGTALIFNGSAIISPNGIESGESIGALTIIGGAEVIGWLTASIEVQPSLVGSIEVDAALSGQVEVNHVH